MADAAIAYFSTSVTVNRWYQFKVTVIGDTSQYRVKLRYNTEAVDEFDSGAIAGAFDVHPLYVKCFEAQYTDADFRIMLSAVVDGSNVKFNDVSFKEVLLEGGIDFSYEYSETDRNSDWIRLNPQGVISPMVSANDFKFKLRATDYRASKFQLDYINVRWKLVDKRGVRGPYVS